jgi:outer membrane lipopolysaccharide assembly protein LptE/RlpB
MHQYGALDAPRIDAGKQPAGVTKAIGWILEYIGLGKMDCRLKPIFVLFALVTLAGCGYQFSRGPALPGNARRIHISIFENRTSESGIENVLAAEIIEEFTIVHQADLASDRQSADTFLTGVVSSVQIFTISRIGESVSDERRIRITVRAELTDPKGRTLKQIGRITNSEAYSVDPDNPQVTEANKREAIAKVANKLSEQIYNRLSREF